MSAAHTPGPRYERKQFFCGRRPSGDPVHKFGWVAHMPDGRVIGDETVNRGNHASGRWEPRYVRREDIVFIAEAHCARAAIAKAQGAAS